MDECNFQSMCSKCQMKIKNAWDQDLIKHNQKRHWTRQQSNIDKGFIYKKRNLQAPLSTIFYFSWRILTRVNEYICLPLFLVIFLQIMKQHARPRTSIPQVIDMTNSLFFSPESPNFSRADDIVHKLIYCLLSKKEFNVVRANGLRLH